MSSPNGTPKKMGHTLGSAPIGLIVYNICRFFPRNNTSKKILNTNAFISSIKPQILILRGREIWLKDEAQKERRASMAETPPILPVIIQEEEEEC
jgi:hypothetical protein